MKQKISRCLISVSDKSGIIELAHFLAKSNIEIISTGGTYKLLKENNIPVVEISSFTDFPEMMDGRLKTLHPKVHGGLLAVLDNEDHKKQALENHIKSIDLLIVNLYPFVETLAKTNDEDEIIENIDIGGPAMVRSAAKNFRFKTVITSPKDYAALTLEMQNNQGSSSYEFRRNMAAQAFQNIAEYDIAIANFFNNNSNFILNGKIKQSLRYGENSHQKAAIYSDSESGIVNSLQLQGKELSYNNFNDSDAAYNLALEFEQPTCVIVKHANPCGVATSNNLLEAYKKALATDPKSAFGGIVALNQTIDESLAEELSKMFFEVIIAKNINEEAKKILELKKNLRVLLADFTKSQKAQIKSISGGFLMQDSDQKTITKSDLRQVSKIGVSDKEIEELIFSMTVCKHVKSNAIVISSGKQIIGIGAGQTSRVDACEIACKKATEFFDKNKDLIKDRSQYMASDAFFPFADNIEIASSYGIKAIVAPQGSIRDSEVIAMANEKGIALYFIESRHFKH